MSERDLTDLWLASMEPILLAKVEEAYDDTGSWDQVDDSIDAVIAFGNAIAARTLARLQAHPDPRMRAHAAMKLASLTPRTLSPEEKLLRLIFGNDD